MAGIPYDLLGEDDLTDAALLSSYEALVIPLLSHVPLAKLDAVVSALDTAVNGNGVSVVTTGNFLTNDETGAPIPPNAYTRMQQILGLTLKRFDGGVPMIVRAEDVTHPVMRDFAPGQVIRDVPVAFFETFTYEGIGAVEFDVLATREIDGETDNAILASRSGPRIVHFGSVDLLGESNFAWSAIQWAVHGDDTLVGLKLTRDDMVFVARNDMDESRFGFDLRQTEFPLLKIITDWKERFDFVGSFYINIGNDPADGEFTDWSVSGPLYREYIALGNEIGTHSYTHPDFTSLLTPTELEFEFNRSRIEIGENVGNRVVGAAIPGNPETLAVNEELDKYMEYTSGRYSAFGSGYPGAFGALTPDFDMTYLSLSLFPDFTWIEFMGLTAEEAELGWAEQIGDVTRHTSQPIVHWLWHDYAVTNRLDAGYTVEMFENTIGLVRGMGAEFATGEDVVGRIATLRNAEFACEGTDVIDAKIGDGDFGTFSLLVRDDRSIGSVDGWYAYDDDQVFVPDGGGSFTIHLGAPEDATHVAKLPMRASLTSVAGDGQDLRFTFTGEGAARVDLTTSAAGKLHSFGAETTTLDGDTLVMDFGGFDDHFGTVWFGSRPSVDPFDGRAADSLAFVEAQLDDLGAYVNALPSSAFTRHWYRSIVAWLIRAAEYYVGRAADSLAVGQISSTESLLRSADRYLWYAEHYANRTMRSGDAKDYVLSELELAGVLLDYVDLGDVTPPDNDDDDDDHDDDEDDDDDDDDD